MSTKIFLVLNNYGGLAAVAATREKAEFWYRTEGNYTLYEIDAEKLWSVGTHPLPSPAVPE